MPIQDSWRKLIPQQIKNCPDFPGVYELSDILQEMLYIGQTQSLAHTLQELYEKKPPGFATVSFFRFHATTEYEAEYKQLIDEYKQKFNKLPPLNKEPSS